MQKTIVILGAGPGIGQAVAKQFGVNGFKVALIGRNIEKLNALVNELSDEEIVSKGFVADVTQPENLKQAITEIRNLGTIEVVHYNAASVSMVNILNETTDTLIEDLR